MIKAEIKKPRLRWLFGGFGFHNSEATMLGIMNDKFKNEKVLKVFGEISPTYSRVFAGYADWTKEAMDSFADYYDLTFRKSDTLLYLVPGRMPIPYDDFDIEEYCEKVAVNLEYLIKVRNCTKIRYYCVTNELSCASTYAYLSNHLDVFEKLHTSLFKSFRKHELDIGLLATDSSGTFLTDKQLPWAIENLNNITECYCGHLYVSDRVPGDIDAYDCIYNTLKGYVQMCRKKEKRFILGEYGLVSGTKWNNYIMSNDGSYTVDYPESDGLYALSVAEYGIAAINSGCFAVVFWSLFDYPDPFIRENGDSKEAKARYDVSRFSGHGIDIRYNKNGLVKWCDDEKDYSSRAALYTLGYMAKFFKKGSRVLETEVDDKFIRAAAITNSDGSMTSVFLNMSNSEKNLTVNCEHKIDKPFRKYIFEADNPPYNDFCDLQPFSELVFADSNCFTVNIPAYSLIYFTTDYVDRLPSEINNIRIENGYVKWDKTRDLEHCYYRVYRDGVQIASTVSEYTAVADEEGRYRVVSVDKYGNVGKIND